VSIIRNSEIYEHRESLQESGIQERIVLMA